mmetsp:Transcript_27833/g.80126  ORF Transcript_27833/g.80126 Transcript_27833/m.80126 type:complete len:206 (-) Transcript_27833:1426-2043(-)
MSSCINHPNKPCAHHMLEGDERPHITGRAGPICSPDSPSIHPSITHSTLLCYHQLTHRTHHRHEYAGSVLPKILPIVLAVVLAIRLPMPIVLLLLLLLMALIVLLGGARLQGGRLVLLVLVLMLLLVLGERMRWKGLRRRPNVAALHQWIRREEGRTLLSRRWGVGEGLLRAAPLVARWRCCLGLCLAGGWGEGRRCGAGLHGRV